MKTEIEGSDFSGFKRVLNKGALIFAHSLVPLIFYQHQRSEEAVHSVDPTRQIIAYIDALRTYLLNPDTAVRKYADTQNPADLDLRQICHQSLCPSVEPPLACINKKSFKEGLHKSPSHPGICGSSCMKQISLATTGFETVTKRTHKREFLDEMNLMVPWVDLIELIEPHARDSARGAGYRLRA